MRNKLVALLMISLMAILVAFVPQRALTTPTTWGPRIEHIRYPTYLSPDAQTLAMQRRDVEFLTDMIRPVDVEILAAEGRQIFAAPYAHFSYIAFNMKNWWLGPIDGSDGPGRALRHAMAHLVPKDELIGTGSKYIVTKIEAPGPVAQGEWYNSNVDPHPYDPQMAYNILINGGWTWDTGDNRWELAAPFAGYPAGTPMPTTTLYSPEFETAPTSWEIMRTSVERMTGAGPFATTPLPAVHTPIDFNVLLDILDFEPARSLSADEGGWDAYFLCYSDLGDTAEFLFSLHHSSQDTEKGDNQMHLHNDAVDAQLDIIKTSLDHSAKVTAAHKAYELLMGSTLLQYTPTTDGIIARIPIYSRAMYAATDEGLGGIVNMLLTGVDQSYTFANMYWSNPAGHESDLVPGGSMVIFCNQEKLQTPLSPAYASSEYSRMVMDYLYDGLIRTNPYYLERFAWILDASEDPDYPDTPGYYVETTGPDVPPGGMKVTYWLVDDTPLWHDGHPVDAFDVEFAWEFQKEYEIGRWWDTFMYFDHADVIDVPANRTIVAYMTATSQFTPFAMAEMALMFPEHIWGCTHERGGRATPDCTYVAQYAEMYDGTPVTVESGLCGCAPGPAHVAPEKTTCIHGSGCVIDHPDTTPNEVYAYDPSTYSWATEEFPWLTELVGTGGFVFRNYNPTAAVADIVAFDAARTGEAGGDPNVHYWKTTNELHQVLVDMFHRAGDVNWDGMVDVDDQVRMADAYGCEVGHPWYDPDADLNEDGIVDAEDGNRIFYNFGRLRETNPSGGSTSSSLDYMEQQSFSSKSLETQESSSSTETTIYVDPPTVINETLQPPSVFAVNMNISDVSNLRTWQVKMSWDPSVLQATGVTFGDFLKGNPNETLDSSPYDDLTIETYSSMTNPWASHDLNPASYTSFKYSDTTGSFVVGNCSRDPYWHSQIIQVDLKVRYEATASVRNDQYRILYYGGSYEHPTAKYTLVDWTSAASPLATHVWTNPTNPYGGAWDWTDITKLQIEVETDRGTGDANAVFDLYEAWITVHYIRPTYFIYRMNNDQGWCLASELTLGRYPGVTGSGRLANVEFQVLAYGDSVLDITHPPTKLIGARRPARIPHITRNGYFKNTILCDIRGPEDPPGSGLYPPDGTVDGWDYAFIGLAFGKTSADPAWDDYKVADIRGPENPPGSGLYPPDGVVDGWDYAYCGLRFGDTVY